MLWRRHLPIDSTMKYLVASVISILATFTSFSTAAGDIPATFQVSPHRLVVVPVGGWHINEDYPWRAKSGNCAVPFRLKWNEAAAEPPPGDVTVVGGLCSATTCISFKKNLTVPK